MGDGYRLGPVRDERARQQRIREGDLAAAVGDARATQATVDAARAVAERARDAIAAARSARDAQLAAGAKTHEIALSERHLTRLVRNLDGAQDALARALASHRGQVAAIDAARNRLVLARADKEIIERHFARWRTERTKLAERRED